MAALWSLVSVLLLASASSLAELQEKDASKKSGGPKSIIFPVYPGLLLGYQGAYYVKIRPGTPAKDYVMVIDTGSSFSWLQCQPCAVYCHTQVLSFFDPSLSTTYKNLSYATRLCQSLYNASLSISTSFCDGSQSSDPCVYNESYGDESISLGYLSQDLLTLPPYQTRPLFVFGCGQYNQGSYGKTDGMLGLGRHNISLIGQLSTTYGHGFSYCLPSAVSAPASAFATTKFKGGFLSIGNSSFAAFSAYRSTTMFTNTQSPDLYFLRLKAITVAGRQLGVAAAEYRVPTFIDSGAEYTFLPVRVYDALQKAFKNNMSKYEEAPGNSELDTCFKGSLKSMSQVPKIQMIFQGGANLTLRTPNVFKDFADNVTCLAFAPVSQPLAVIGNHQQQTFGVAYDVSNSGIKFAPGFCP